MDNQSPTVQTQPLSKKNLLLVLLGVTAVSVVVAIYAVRQFDTVLTLLNKKPIVGACSTATRSVSDAYILTRLDFSYPCGWHVVEQALLRDTERRGMVSDIIYVNPDPISFAPRGGDVSRVILRVDEQDQNKKFPRLPTLARSINDIKKGLITSTTTTLPKNKNGFTWTKIEGTEDVFGNIVPVVFYVTELFDLRQPERRMILRLWAGNPKWEDGSVEKALEQIVGTMKQIE